MTDDDYTTLITDVWPPIAERWLARGFGGLSPQQQMLVRVWRLVAEVDNGGLAQYLVNARGGEGPLAIEGLRRMGASQLADDLRAVLAALPGGGLAATEYERQAQIDALGPDARALERFDRALYAADRYLERRMVMFARQHLAQRTRRGLRASFQSVKATVCASVAFLSVGWHRR
jgi:hypothetical protein